MKQNVFLVEDELDIALLIRHHLEAAGFTVSSFASAVDVVQTAELNRPSLFLIDIMLPGGNGLDLCRRLRKVPPLAKVPIIFVTARTAETDRVAGLELGADDYITKPFSPREMVARVKAVLRRYDRPTAPARLSAGPIELDSEAMSLTVSGVLVPTTLTEFRLLEHLMRHAGQVFTRDQLLDAVWQESRYVTDRSVDVYVRRLRGKIEQDPENPRFLRTVRGAGYRFDAVQ
ncbi:MAG TPA: response regulator transcription factor [Terriglobales bacterium]|jgi:two-component system phosphate regulon response regulator PhoB|nr:response regulator transcription factor [Terriglobales bacterium]